MKSLIYLLLLSISITLTSNAQSRNCNDDLYSGCYVEGLESYANQYKALYEQAQSNYTNELQNKYALQNQITILESQLNSITPEDGVNQSHVDAAYANGAASVTPEDGVNQSHVDAAYANGAASVTPEDGVNQSHVDAAYANGAASVTPEDGVNQSHVDAAYANGAASVTPEDGVNQSHVDAAYANGAASVTPEDGVNQSHVDAVTPLRLDMPMNLPNGWSMFGYTCVQPLDVIDGFVSVKESLEIVKDEMGLAYLPDYNFNAIGDLKHGEGYQIKLTNSIEDFQFCKTLVPKVFGCTDANAFNYNPDANTEDDSCIPVLTGCMDEDAFNFDAAANTNDDSCIEKVFGCTDSEAFNYNAEANTNDDSCIAKVNGCMDSNGWDFNPLANSERDCLYLNLEVSVPSYDSVVSMLECLGSQAHYDSPWLSICANDAFETIDSYEYYMHEGSSDEVEKCVFEGPYGQQYCNQALENEPIELISVLTGTCYASNACNYLEQGICDYTSCVGCQDPTAFNYDAEATVASECIPVIEGCIDDAACNFEPEANTDDGSCYNNNLGCGCDNPAPIEGLNCQGNPIQIGDVIYGGMVFQINEDGTALVVSTKDLGVMTWSDAQNSASNSRTEGYEDWYLPNIDQLESLYNSIGPGGDNSLGLEFQAGQYSSHWKLWSSSITPSNSNYVYILNFVDGEVNENYYPQNWTYSSRPIRSIDLGCTPPAFMNSTSDFESPSITSGEVLYVYYDNTYITHFTTSSSSIVTGATPGYSGNGPRYSDEDYGTGAVQPGVNYYAGTLSSLTSINEANYPYWVGAGDEYIFDTRSFENGGETYDGVGNFSWTNWTNKNLKISKTQVVCDE